VTLLWSITSKQVQRVYYIWWWMIKSSKLHLVEEGSATTNALWLMSTSKGHTLSIIILFLMRKHKKWRMLFKKITKSKGGLLIIHLCILRAKKLRVSLRRGTIRLQSNCRVWLRILMMCWVILKGLRRNLGKIKIKVWKWRKWWDKNILNFWKLWAKEPRQSNQFWIFGWKEMSKFWFSN